MTFIEMLFSFKGRIGRLTYWGLCFALLGIELLGLYTFYILDIITSSSQNGLRDLVFLLFLVFICLIFWSLLAITVKRWHDRNKSGWWIFIGLIPIIGALWTTIELGFLKGTEGENRFGERAY